MKLVSSFPVTQSALENLGQDLTIRHEEAEETSGPISLPDYKAVLATPAPLHLHWEPAAGLLREA